MSSRFDHPLQNYISYRIYFVKVEMDSLRFEV